MALRGTLRESIGLEYELLVGHSKTFLGPRLVFAKTSRNIEQGLAFITHGVVGDNVFAGICKAIVIDDANVTIGFSHKVQGLIDMLHLIVMRMGLTIRTNEAIDTEGSVVGFIAEISTIEEIRTFNFQLSTFNWI